MLNHYLIPAILGFLIFDAAILAVIIAILKIRKRGNPYLNALGEFYNLKKKGGEALIENFKLLSFLKKPTYFEGDKQGHRLKIFHYTQGTGKNSTTYAAAVLYDQASQGISFSFGKEGFFSKIGKIIGMQDVQSGDEKFDKEFIIKCSEPTFIHTLLTPMVKENFFKAFDEHRAQGSIRLKDNELRYDEKGSIRNEASRDRFIAVIDLLSELQKTYNH